MTVTSADVGIILTDLTLRPIAFDRGAVTILNGSEEHKRDDPFQVPEEVVQMIRRCKFNEISTATTLFRKGEDEYRCRAYLIESSSHALPHRIIALQLQRHLPARDSISHIGSEYHLTIREQQALSWIALGLTSKEVADRMSISPNTVKAFLRLIMIKMGVSTRAGVVAKLLEIH